MQTPLANDDLWMRRGISLLWDADCLNQLCRACDVISIRQFFQLYHSRWPATSLDLVRETTLVVAGLESCIDAFPPDEASRWLQEELYPGVLSFQQEVADGGTQAALVLWLADQKRLVYQASDDAYYWHCGTEYRGELLPLGQCLFNGAHRDLQQILRRTAGRQDELVGLFHRRIS